jgi:hypothetical protein
MKKIIFLLVVFSVVIPAQSKDSVDIKALVQKQIEVALERDRQEQAKRDSVTTAKAYFGPERDPKDEIVEFWGPMPEFIGPLEAVLPTVQASAVKDSAALVKAEKEKQLALQKIITAPVSIAKETPKSSSGSLWKLYLIGGVSVIAFSFVFVRRLLQRGPKNQVKTIKNNIRIIREESLVKRDQPQLKALRSKLVNSPVILNNHGKPLAAVAKELNISQGEIILAAKIKSYELAKEENGKWYLN